MVLNKLLLWDFYYEDRNYFEGKEFVEDENENYYKLVDDKDIKEASEKYGNSYVFIDHDNLWVKEK